MFICGYILGTLWVQRGYICRYICRYIRRYICRYIRRYIRGYIVGTVRKGAIISFTYCSFNTFKFKGSNMFDKPNRVVVGDGGGPTFKTKS